jgi:glycosyltransferase involved in cell wall biosynthesis
MLLSILVPVYNSERYLIECFESALGQTGDDFELVLVDDGSNDGSGAICDRYAAQYPDRVRVIHQPNGGLIMARRAGIRAAKGEYCMFLDADDAYEPNCLATIRETIRETGADVVIFNNYSFFEEDGKVEPNRAAFADGSVFEGTAKRLIYEKLIASEELNNIWFKAIRTELLQADDTDYPFYADNPHGEDLLQSLYPLTHAQKIVYRDKRLYRYRRHRSSMTRQMDAQRLILLFDRRGFDQLRHYMTIWGMETQQDLQKLYARTTRGTLSIFWLQYRSAHTAAERRAVLDFTWNVKFDVNTRQTFRNPYLSRMHKIQVRAILNKQRILLDCIGMLGKLKMRASHGA